jgi:hypothetical protein
VLVVSPTRSTRIDTTSQEGWYAGGTSKATCVTPSPS